MSGHLTSTQIEDYCRHKLSAGELLSVSDHLEACESCRQMVERVLNGEAVFFALRSGVLDEGTDAPRSSPTATHLTLQQTTEYADDILAVEEQPWVKDHLASCEQCALAVEDLRIFRSQVAPSLNRKYHPGTFPAPTESAWLRWVLFSPTRLLRSPTLAFGSALTVFLLVVAGWLAWQTGQDEQRKPRIAAKTPSPDTRSQTIPPRMPAVSPTPGREGRAGPVIVELNDGEQRLVLDRNGKLSGADNLPSAYKEMLRNALIRQQLEKPSLLAGLNRSRGSLMGGDIPGNTFSVIEPVGKVILSDRPTFRWSQLEGSTSYVVEVFDSKFNLVMASPELAERSWVPPQPLKRGGLYSWQVKALKQGGQFKSPRPPAPQASFRVVDQAKADELAEARQSYNSSHLTLGLLYTQAGLLDQAEQELQALQKNNPNAAVARRLVESLQAFRR